jgi:hypothetical protein
MAAGWQLYRLSPGMWTLLVFTWWILIAVFNQIPYIGPIATTVALPAFMMGFMAMSEALRHGRPRVPLLFVGFSQVVAADRARGAVPAFHRGGPRHLFLRRPGCLFSWMMWPRPLRAALRDTACSRRFHCGRSPCRCSRPSGLRPFWLPGTDSAASAFLQFSHACETGVLSSAAPWSPCAAWLFGVRGCGGHGLRRPPGGMRSFMLAATLVLLPAFATSALPALACRTSSDSRF